MQAPPTRETLKTHAPFAFKQVAATCRSVSRRRVGIDGSSSTRRWTSSGWAAASSNDTIPPIELPTTTAGSPTTSRRKALSSVTLAVTVLSRSPLFSLPTNGMKTGTSGKPYSA